MADLTPEQIIAAEKAAIADGIKAKKDGAKAAEKQRKKDEKRWQSTNKATQTEINKEYEASQEKAAQEKRKQLEEDRKEAGDEHVKKEIEVSISAGLAKQFAADKDETNKGIEEKDLEKQIKGMGSIFNTEEDSERQKALLTEFKEVSTKLKNPDLPPLEKRVLEGRMEELKSASGDEEERREKQLAADEAAGILNRIAEGAEKTAAGFDKFRDGLLAGGGIIAALGTIALLFFDPETLMEGVKIGLEKIRDIVDIIGKMIDGDWKEAFNDLLGFIGENKLLIAGFGLFFAGPIIRGFASMFTSAMKLSTGIGKAAKFLKWAMNGMKVFMLGSFLPAIGAMFTSMATALAPVIVALAPILLPVLAIMALVGGLYWGFKKLQDSLGPGASIMDTLKVAMLYFVDFLSMIVNGITWIPRKIIGMLGPRLAKWIMGDDFDTSFIEDLAEGLQTNRGKTAAAEIRKRNELDEINLHKEKEKGLTGDETVALDSLTDPAVQEALKNQIEQSISDDQNAAEIAQNRLNHPRAIAMQKNRDKYEASVLALEAESGDVLSENVVKLHPREIARNKKVATDAAALAAAQAKLDSDKRSAGKELLINQATNISTKNTDSSINTNVVTVKPQGGARDLSHKRSFSN
jgi:hypothetical protein